MFFDVMDSATCSWTEEVRSSTFSVQADSVRDFAAPTLDPSLHAHRITGRDPGRELSDIDMKALK